MPIKITLKSTCNKCFYKKVCAGSVPSCCDCKHAGNNGNGICRDCAGLYNKTTCMFLSKTEGD